MDRWDSPVFQYVFRTYVILILAFVKTNDSIRRLRSDQAEEKAADLLNIPSVYLEESAQITDRNPVNDFFYCALFQVSAAKGIRTVAFWVVAQQRLVGISYRHFGILDPLTMGPISCPETSVRNTHYSLRNNPEEPSSFFELFTDFPQLYQQPNDGTYLFTYSTVQSPS